jgi:hypothetical protein
MHSKALSQKKKKEKKGRKKKRTEWAFVSHQ